MRTPNFKPPRRLDRWHNWFAWYPVNVCFLGAADFRWLETVRRRRAKDVGYIYLPHDTGVKE